jgi:hypothetical protein
MLTPGPAMGHGSVRSTRAFVFYGAVVLLVVVLVGGTGASLLTPLVGWVTMDRSDPRFVHDLAVSTVLLVAFLAAVVQLVRPAQHVVAALSLGAVVTGIAGVVLLTGGPTSILVVTDALETRDVAVTETPEARGGRVDAFRHSSRHHRRDRESAGRGDGVDRSR